MDAILQTNPMNDKPDDPREQPVAPRDARVVPLRLLTRKVIPARADDLMQTLDCHDATSRLIEKFTLANVARSILCHLEAEGQDIEGVTLDALAQGEERQ